MELYSLFLIALGRSADCFAVTLGLSASAEATLRRVIRVALAFGFFQAAMTLAGWLAGSTVVVIISAYDHWLALALLSIVGGRMIRESFHSPEKRSKTDADKWLVLLTLSVATSIDALAVGLSFAFLRINVALAAGTIGAVALVVTAVAFLLGGRLGRLAGKRAELIGGIILIGIGIRIVVEHLFFG